MSHTIAHRPHVHHDHAALLTFLVVVCVVLIAAFAIWAVNQPEQGAITFVGSGSTPVPSAGPFAVPQPDSPVFRHAQMRVYQNGGPEREYVIGRLHQVDSATSATLDPVSSAALIAIADQYRAELPKR